MGATRKLCWPAAALLLLVATLVVAAGCGGGNDNNNKTAKGGELKTKQAGKLLVGSDIPYPPFEFGREPNYKGVDVDILNEIGRRLNLKVTFQKAVFDTIFRDLVQHKFDAVASAATITPEREKTVDFSIPYFPADQSLMVKKGSGIKTVSDVKGKTVGAQLGTTGAAYAKDKTDANVRTYEQIDDAFNALEAGQVQAVINDCPVSKYAERSHSDLVVVESINTNERYGIAFASQSDALREAVNKALTEMRDDGSLERIPKKWLGAEPCAGLPSSG
jgi:ABC-type amino acid transport substrate-binding protein